MALICVWALSIDAFLSFSWKVLSDWYHYYLKPVYWSRYFGCCCCSINCVNLKRHCSSTTHPSIPTSVHIQDSFTQDSICVVALPPDVHWGRCQIIGGLLVGIWRRYCIAAESLWWCSVVPVLIQHMKDTTYYAPTDDCVSKSHWIKLSELPSREQTATSFPPPILLCGLSDTEGFDQNCPRQGRT